MRPHEERVVQEKAELDAKRDALNNFFADKVFTSLPDDEKGRLFRQAGVMLEYSRILGERIRAFPAT